MAAWDATSRNQWTYCHLAKAINGVLYGPEIEIPHVMRIGIIIIVEDAARPRQSLRMIIRSDWARKRNP